ncbi:hypothetical protein JCM6882_005846 [Rhodosporidiobolus microsporus]
MASDASFRPSAHEANLALASLLAAVQQHHGQSSPAAATAPGTSPAATAGGYTPASSSVAAPTPHGHPALELTSEASTYELMRSLGALGGPPRGAAAAERAYASPAGRTVPSPVTTTTASTSASGSATMSASSSSGGAAGGSAFLAPPSASTSSSAAAPRPSRRRTREPSTASSYQPQPTRSGRMPVAPSTNGELDPATLLFNDYFDFPSSDEEDDPDFDPSILGPEHENDDADGEGDEDGIDWGWWGVDNAPGEDGDAAAGSRVGLTSAEFAAELALLTGAIDTPEGAVGVSPAQHHQPQAQGLETTLSPARGGRTRRSTAAAASTAADKEQSVAQEPATGRKKRASTQQQDRSTTTARKRPRRGERTTLSPVPEDDDAPLPDISVLQPVPRASTSAAVTANPSVLHNQQLPTPLLDPFLQHPPSSSHIPAPPSEDPPSPAHEPEPEPEAQAKKKRNRKSIYTPEEAAKRRKDQEATRQQKRREAEKEKKEGAEKRIKELEEENERLKGENEHLKGRVGDLERRLGEARRKGRPDRRREDGDETSSASEDESDGGEYQVQSSEESSSDEDEDEDATPGGGGGDDGATGDFDRNWGASAVAAELEHLAAAQTAPLPPQLGLDIAQLDGEELAELLVAVTEAARAQGVHIA